MRQCKCILCEVGRNGGYKESNSDYAPLTQVIEAIRAYDVSLSPYTLTEADKEAMIAYASQHAENGVLHSETLEQFFEDRRDGAI